MRVIKQPAAICFSRVVTCGECDADIEIETDDIMFMPDYGRFGESGYYVTCPIPNCGKKIWLSNLPKFVSAQARKRIA